MRRAHLSLLILCLLVLAGVWLLWLNGTYERSAKSDCGIELAGDCVKLERVDTEEARERGLSGRTGLAPTDGMLFVFDEPQLACMWMKDMTFAIDIVWLDDNHKITRIEKEVSPETYPESFCQDETRYVIELKSGVADEAELSVGQKLQL